MSARQNYIMKLADQDVFQIGDKKYNYRKVTNAEFNQLEKLKLDMRNETDVEKGTKMMDDILRKEAELFFGMSGNDYDAAPREDLGYAIEAAMYRSIYGKPFLSENSTTGTGSKEESSQSAEKPVQS